MSYSIGPMFMNANALADSTACNQSLLARAKAILSPLLPYPVEEYKWERIEGFLGKCQQAAVKEQAEDLDKIEQLAATAAGRLSPRNEFYISNKGRGKLLYFLARRKSASSALELGTGRAFGTRCIALGIAGNSLAEDRGGKGTIVSVDILAPSQPQKWVRLVDGQVCSTTLSVSEELKRAPIPSSVDLSLICGSAMTKYDEIKQALNRVPDLIFIDAGHTYWEVRSDLTAAYKLFDDFRLSSQLTVLFDDVIGKMGIGVAKALARHFLPAVQPGHCTFLVVGRDIDDDPDDPPHVMMLFDPPAGECTGELMKHNCIKGLLSKCGQRTTEAMMLLRLILLRTRAACQRLIAASTKRT
jgi:hypothetical protein